MAIPRLYHPGFQAISPNAIVAAGGCVECLRDIALHLLHKL
jgi:hypothetical protein